jgi:hypothetical protein
VGNHEPCGASGTRVGIRTRATGPFPGSSAGSTRNQLSPFVRFVANVTHHLVGVLLPGAGGEDGLTDGQVTGVPLHPLASTRVDDVERVVDVAQDRAHSGDRRERDALVTAADDSVVGPGLGTSPSGRFHCT